MGAVGFFRVHYGAHLWWSGSFGLVVSIGVRPGLRSVHSGPLGSFGRAHGDVQIIKAHSGGRLVHS